MKRLELAARCAVGLWFNTERRLCDEVRHNVCAANPFPKGWHRYWRVGRSLRVDGDRAAIGERLIKYRESLIKAPGTPDGWRLVEKLADAIAPLNKDVRPTSLASKWAFSCAPVTFVPYDSKGREVLRTVEHHYVAYSKAFELRMQNVEEMLNSFVRPDGMLGLTANNLPFYGEIMDQLLFSMRTTDWLLLLEANVDPSDCFYRGPIV